MNIIPNKNPNIIVSKIEDNFYAVVNPFIKDGMKIVNANQISILNLIDGQKTLQQITELTEFSQEDILMVCKILEDKNLVGFSRIFQKPKWNKIVKTLNLWVHTTNDCSLRCSYCYIHTLGLKDYITKETIKIFCNKIVQTVKERNLEQVSLRLAGGEPFLKFRLWKSYLVELKKRLQDVSCKLYISFLSNLVMLNDEIIEFIKENSFGIGVSLDGIGEFQDKTRHFENGKGSFTLVEQHIKQLIENKVFPGLMTVVSNANLDGLEKLTQFAIDNNLHLRLSFIQGEQIDIPKLTTVLYKCYDLYEKAIDDGFQFSKLHKLCDLKLSTPFFQTCSNGFNGGALYTDGNIYFCQKSFGTDIPNGSIFEEDDLLTLLQRKTHYGDVHLDCLQCSYQYLCTSGCPLERENGKDLHCEVYKEFIPIIFKLRGKEKLRELKKHYQNNDN